ncbi:teichoic acid D-Ala incorporation-associated protein DltX [Listeria sp. PSOL-1]|uniref:teichoic acid D-Ala incorporation-associated protein DltX n=1 Tax=Listeria sp. PSOL-1 TaxID=1844999 RepID=UPI0013D05624|nr:teichoic acid D-Ala incorporation-associated protein DltX [Listeria sp. PSOL-1]
MNIFSKLKLFFYKPSTIFVLKTLFYLIVLLSLLWFYGFKNPNSTNFVYNEF